MHNFKIRSPNAFPRQQNFKVAYLRNLEEKRNYRDKYTKSLFAQNILFNSKTLLWLLTQQCRAIANLGWTGQECGTHTAVWVAHECWELVKGEL